MARKSAADKVRELQEKMKVLEEQLKEEERKRDEELGKIIRIEWDIEDSETARIIITSLKSEVEKIKRNIEVGNNQNESSNSTNIPSDNEVTNEHKEKDLEDYFSDKSNKTETLVSQS